MPMLVHTRSAEVKLMQSLSEIRDLSSGWNAVHFHLNALLEEYNSEYQVKIAINLIHDLLKTYDGGVFLMMDNSIIVLCYGVEKTVLNKLVFQLRYLYMDDPLSYNELGEENPNFCTVYDLKYQIKAFYEVCSKRMSKSVRPSMAPERPHHAEPEKPVAAPARGPVLTSERSQPAEKPAVGLASLGQDLARIDLGPMIRRQPVCGVLPGRPVRRVFD